MNTGKMPWEIRERDVRLVFNNPSLKKAIVLDAAGYPVREVQGKEANGQLTIRLSTDAMYFVLE